MFTDMPIERYIEALLNVPPNRRTGYITKQDLGELRLFIAGEDGRLLGTVPLITRRGLSPIPNVAYGDIQRALLSLEKQGKVKRFGPWYAWASVATSRARLKAAVHAPLIRYRLRRLTKQGDRLLAEGIKRDGLDPLIRAATHQEPPTEEADGSE